jgi:SAM-dependent methyltransferase
MANTIKNSATYNHGFYSATEYATRCAAEKISALILELFDPRSVADVGCGNGIWLEVFDRAESVERIFGLDGNSVPDEDLLILPKYFKRVDLELEYSEELEGRFDVVTCFEVAEHISPANAVQFIRNLTEISDVVVFSAAIPFQKGVCHVNENWPEYWARIFRSFGYVPVDCIRRKVWYDDDVAFWYKQNTFAYVKEPEVERYFPGYDAAMETPVLSAVHPYLFCNLLGRVLGEAGRLSALDYFKETTDPEAGLPPQREIHLLSSKLDDALTERDQWQKAYEEMETKYVHESAVMAEQAAQMQAMFDGLADTFEWLQNAHYALMKRTGNPAPDDALQQTVFAQQKHLQKMEMEMIMLKNELKKRGDESAC